MLPNGQISWHHHGVVSFSCVVVQPECHQVRSAEARGEPRREGQGIDAAKDSMSDYEHDPAKVH